MPTARNPNMAAANRWIDRLLSPEEARLRWGKGVLMGASPHRGRHEARLTPCTNDHADDEDSVQPPVRDRPGAVLHRPGARARPPVGRRQVHQGMPCLARGADRRRQGAADPFVHGRAGNGRAVARPEARRRSDHAVVHLRPTANASVLRGAVPVFVDIRPDTLNLDESLVEAAITPRTRAICVVHYAGVSCEMDEILAIAQRHGLAVVEDAAQGIMSTYKGRELGAIGARRAEFPRDQEHHLRRGGRRVVGQRPRAQERAEIIREKGTNRSKFFRGQVDKYTWVSGLSHLPSEILAAFLAAQLEQADSITGASRWDRYHAWASAHEAGGRLRRPVVPEHCTHNAHMYYLLRDLDDRSRFIARLRENGIGAVFHYIPLHSSPAGFATDARGGRIAGDGFCE